MRKGKLVLFRDVSKQLLFAPTTPEEAKKVRSYYSKDSTSFGWMSPDYRQVILANDNIANAIAKPEDFIAFPFRHLSATIVGGGSWKATEFSEKVLKAAADKFSFNPVFVNHEMETSNQVATNGQIKFVSKSGDVPGGLEGPIWVDGLLHPDITRKLTSFPVPTIQSVSVTITYNWEPSHEFTDTDNNVDDWEFEKHIGSIVEGSMVRRIATLIIDSFETSFVWLGSDPFAKIVLSQLWYYYSMIRNCQNNLISHCSRFNHKCIGFVSSSR